SDVFIAHIVEDADVSLEIALGLEEAGYNTWFYEIDSIPGPSYLLQTGQAVAQSKAVIVVISPNSIGSNQVTKEIVRAHETGKQFVPLLRGITHVEFQNRQPEWREAIGAATSLSIRQEGIAGILPRVIDGLKSLGLLPSLKADTARIARIRRELAELRGHGISEKGQEQKVPSIKPEPEAIAAEAPLAKTAKGTGERPKWLRPVLIVSPIIILCIVAVIFLSQPEETQPLPSPSPPPSTTPAVQTLPPSTTPVVQTSPPSTTPVVQTPPPTPPTIKELTLADAPMLLNLSTLLPASFEEADATAMGVSNNDLGLGLDFSEVVIFAQEDPFQIIVCYLTLVEDSFSQSIVDAIFNDDEQVESLIKTNIIAGFDEESLDLSKLELNITHPDMGDLAVFGEGYISTAGIDIGYDIYIFREGKVFVNIESMYLTLDKQSLEPIVPEIIRRINTFEK
ncbi:MAG: TIR domain-containing protein, partial [Dehalococcoidales bacterium]|nr:TIR domain-containing protein [Dehalococcoidales bacterium]